MACRPPPERKAARLSSTLRATWAYDSLSSDCSRRHNQAVNGVVSSAAITEGRAKLANVSYQVSSGQS